MFKIAVVTFFALSFSSAFAAQKATPVLIPAGTEIKMYVEGDVAAQSLHAGDVFAAQAAADVVVDGVVVVRKGAEGEGTIREDKAPGSGAHTNRFTLAFDWVSAVDGTKISLNSSAASQARKGASAATLSSTLGSFGIAGFFGIVSAFANDSISVQSSLASR